MIYKKSTNVFWTGHPTHLEAGGGSTNAGVEAAAGSAYHVGTGTTGETSFTLANGSDDYAATV